MTVDKKKIYFCMFLRLNNLFVAVNYIYKKQRPTVRRQFVFIFYNFLPMSRSRFLNKVSGKSIFKGATSRSLSLLYLVRCLLLSFFALFLRSQLIKKGNCAMARPLDSTLDLLQKSETDSKKKSYF